MGKELESKDYREAFVDENIKNAVAFQVNAMRERRGWTQSELGRRANKPQNVISRIEDPNYGKVTIRTLLDIAAAFDVALLVKFVSFGDLLAQMRHLSPQTLAVPSFDEERQSRMSRPSSFAELTAPRFQNAINSTEDVISIRGFVGSGAHEAAMGKPASRAFSRELNEISKH